MVNEAIEAAETLEAEGVSVELINMHTIKPLDKEAVIKAAKKTGCIVTAEEHNIIGGLGSAVAEAVAEECPAPVIRVGVNDEFGKSGPAVELLHLYGLDAENIVAKAKIAISKK
jgi:transketolase